ncbi:hypothetical protein D3C77_536650 [compost metagenome]
MAHAICFRTADHLESLVQIEAQSLRVLFVDIELNGVEFVDGVVQQAFAQPLATHSRIDKEHFHASGGNPGKTGNPLLGVFAADQHHRIQILADQQFAQQTDIAVRQEVMGCPHRRLPDTRQLRVVA